MLELGRLFSARCKIERVFLAKGFPLTPDPSPQKFGVSLVRLGSLTVRIYGERGASIEQRESKVSTIGLAALTTGDESHAIAKTAQSKQQVRTHELRFVVSRIWLRQR